MEKNVNVLGILKKIVPLRVLIMMKLSVFFICFATLGSIASGTYSQSTKISLNLRQTTIKNALKEIENTSTYYFLYNNDLINVDKVIDVKVEKEGIEEVLDQLFKGESVKYMVMDRQIIISPENTISRTLSSQATITGKVTDGNGQPLPGVTVVVKGTTQGTITDGDGNYTLPNVPGDGVLVFSFVGMRIQEIPIEGRTTFTVVMEEEIIGMEEVVVVGYGTQKKSDITGAVASLDEKRLDMVPNLNIAQAIQGAIPGVMIRTSSAGAAPEEVIMIRGRNSILASNDPLIVLDGIPYSGLLSDINPNNVQSIEVLKDASSAAIYGSRGANGVILVTTKSGVVGKVTISYDGKYSIQNASNLPDLMNGEEFYNFKLQREPDFITQTEQQVYESGEWVDWVDLATRTGHRQQHNISVTGGQNNIKYYISGELLDVKGVRVNDDFKRFTNQINLDIEITKWFSVGTRTILSFDDRSGQSPSSGVWRMNPLSIPYDENGNLTIYPWPEDIYFENPLESLLFEDKDKSFQVVANNYAIVDFPFISGLNYRANLGIRKRTTDRGSYAGRNTGTGFEVIGLANTNGGISNNTVFENILSYNRAFDKHSIFATVVYSFEENENSTNGLNARGFPHDFLSWHAAGQAEVVSPSNSYNQTVLISQMLRFNYAYDSRYLLTLTGRRDGFSGFGAKDKWGIFPSVAIGWNLANEAFFPWKKLFNEMKLRASFGRNGNQAVGAYETIAKLGSYDIVSRKTSVPGYVPTSLGQDNLGWESSETLNVGLDFGIFSGRVAGGINIYNTNTTDLLLNRTISAVHGITSITQNIGQTQNNGLEFSIASRNIVSGNFRWLTSGNLSLMHNKIVSLYGFLDEDGNEIDDIANNWFIGQPIRVNYNYVMTGVWQLDEAEEAALYNSNPGYVKFKDVNDDKIINATHDREIIGQQDPKFIWGMSNTFSYKNFNLDIFIHGVHGVTRANELMVDDVYETVRRNTINKNWWTPDNPTNDFYANDKFAASIIGGNESKDWYYENASFIRVKDITLSYDFSNKFLSKMKFEKLRVYVTGSNLFTFTKWRGMDPELDEQRESIYQKEFVLGLTLGF